MVLLVYGFAFGVWLAPSLGALRAPVFCYMAAILTMVAAAERAEYRSRCVLLGAVLFLISDSLLGANRFKTDIPLVGFLTWTTYYGGQFAITWGVLSAPALRATVARRRTGVSRNGSQKAERSAFRHLFVRWPAAPAVEHGGLAGREVLYIFQVVEWCADVRQ